MTNVIRIKTLALLLVVLSGSLAAQVPESTTGPAESLYLRLRSVGLDKSRVYRIREASLDRASMHLSFEDGSIAFTQDAGGHVTGAFFRGDGELLLSPPNTVERASLALFTGAAILEEKFSIAYLRFNDDVLGELRPYLRDATDADKFSAAWDGAAQTLAQEDALRLLVSFNNEIGGPGPKRSNDHLLHAYLQGGKHGSFDVRYDSLLLEQITAGQHQTLNGVSYYDVWTSFSVPVPGGTKTVATQPTIPEFEITQFKIESQVRPPTELESTATLEISPRQSGSRLLLFELSRLLQVKSAQIEGKPVEYIHNQAVEGSQLAQRGNDALAVVLPTPLRLGEKFKLTLHYSGAVVSEAANGLLYVGEHGTWYPNVGFQMSSFDLEFHYPPGWTLLATGRRTDLKTIAGEQVSRWQTERPVPVAGFNLGRYSRTVIHVGKVDVETYATQTVERGFPQTTDKEDPVTNLTGRRRANDLIISKGPSRPSPSQHLQMVGNAAATALEFYQQRFGTYPYASLQLTQFPGKISQGWPGLIFLSSYAFLDRDEQEQIQSDPKRQLLFGQIVPHETAHEWWGDSVMWSGYRDQWIMEALANYSALMLLESHNSGQAKELLQLFRDDLLTKNHEGASLMDSGPVTLGVRLSSSRFPGAYETISYGRGTWLFHMLRTMLRDAEPTKGNAKGAAEEPFVRVLRKLRTEYEFKPVTTQQVIAAFEADLPRPLWYEGHKSLNWFLDSWVNGTAVPQLSLHDVKFVTESEHTRARGTIVQEHAPDSLVTSVPLYAVVAGRNVFLGRIFAEGHETQFRIAVPAGAHKILIDPEQTLLSRNK